LENKTNAIFVEEKKIIVDQSIYEPPATQRQVKIDLEKTERTYNQALENYSLKFQKAQADMKEVEADLTKAQRRLNEYLQLKEDFVVTAPKSGMLNYKRGWDGKKQGVGSQISAWDNVVATLPNLSAMNSRTYINEIDISKVAVGQKAEIEVDAFPGKLFTGEVKEVANMGEQMQNSNAKVFEVMIHINEFDSILRPSMTTKNRIITEVIDSALYIPIECMNANDSITFVYSEQRRKQVITGKSNETDIVILAGINEGEELYLVPPEKADTWDFKLLDKETLKKFEEKAPQQIDNIPEKPDKDLLKRKGEPGNRPSRSRN
jgi:multidrug efflux pump subunit AcrA (membrane-fusion protein)